MYTIIILLCQVIEYARGLNVLKLNVHWTLGQGKILLCAVGDAFLLIYVVNITLLGGEG